MSTNSAVIQMVIVGGVLFTVLLKRVVHRYTVYKAQQAQIATRDPLLADLQLGKPAVIYFTSPGCGPCRLTQSPILQRLQQERGDSVQMLTVNIDRQLDVALRWGVMNVPRTFVLDRNLRPYVSNLDVASLNTLQRQLDEAEYFADQPPQPLKLAAL